MRTTGEVGSETTPLSALWSTQFARNEEAGHREGRLTPASMRPRPFIYLTEPAAIRRQGVGVSSGGMDKEQKYD